jgi:hypothetical protein
VRGYTRKVGLRPPRPPLTLAEYEAIAREYLSRPPDPNYVNDFLAHIHMESDPGTSGNNRKVAG